MVTTRRSARLTTRSKDIPTRRYVSTVTRANDTSPNNNDINDKKGASTNNKGGTKKKQIQKRKATSTMAMKGITRSSSKKRVNLKRSTKTDNSQHSSSKKRCPKQPQRASKRRKTTPDPCIRKPMTRSRRKNKPHIPSLVVTPSPAPGRRLMESIDRSSSSISSNQSLYRKQVLSFDEESSSSESIPDQVQNIDRFPSCCHRRNIKTNQYSCNCIHQLDHNHASTLSERYLYTYGKDYNKYLRETEMEPFHNDPPLAALSVDTYVSHEDSDSEIDYSSSDDSSVSSISMSTSVQRHFATVTPLPVIPGCPGDVVLNDYMQRQTDLSPEMRGILIDWLIELTDEYNISPKTFHMAVALVDRSLAAVTFDGGPHYKTNSKTPRRGFLVKRDLLQCVGCACMLVASKLEEVSGPSVDDFVYISDSSYTRKEITKMELKICTALKFHLRYVTPHDFVDRFLRASHVSSLNRQLTPTLCCSGSNVHNVLKYMVQYLLELAAMQYKLVDKPPSIIAASAVYLARATLGIYDQKNYTKTKRKKVPQSKQFWSQTLQHYTGYCLYDLDEITLIIHEAQMQAEKSDLRSVFTKYKSSKYHRVALKTILPKNKLGFT